MEEEEDGLAGFVVVIIIASVLDDDDDDPTTDDPSTVVTVVSMKSRLEVASSFVVLDVLQQSAGCSNHPMRLCSRIENPWTPMAHCIQATNVTHIRMMMIFFLKQ
jgi:hypothetical protein